MSDSRAFRIPRKLPREKAFYFFTSIGNYTGEKAASLEEFVKKTGEISVRSLEFHLYRGDFERWTAETLEDSELADRIGRLKRLGASGESLRDQLHLLVSKRYEEQKAEYSAQPSEP